MTEMIEEPKLTLAEWTKRIDPNGRWGYLIPDLERHPHYITSFRMDGDEFSRICELLDQL